MSVKVYWPWNNLGCLGFKIGRVYVDFFTRPYWGGFVNTGQSMFWFSKRGIRRGR